MKAPWTVVAAMSNRIQLPLGPLETKAKAMDEATVFARDVGVRDVIFESDSSTICHTLEDHYYPNIHLYYIVRDTL